MKKCSFFASPGVDLDFGNFCKCDLFGVDHAECGGVQGDLCVDYRKEDQRFIPVSERLPEEEGKYLVVYRHGRALNLFVMDYMLNGNELSWIGLAHLWNFQVLGWKKIDWRDQMDDLMTSAEVEVEL